jgi:hypothetical protein
VTKRLTGSRRARWHEVRGTNQSRWYIFLGRRIIRDLRATPLVIDEEWKEFREHP